MPKEDQEKVLESLQEEDIVDNFAEEPQDEATEETPQEVDQEEAQASDQEEESQEEDTQSQETSEAEAEDVTPATEQEPSEDDEPGFDPGLLAASGLTADAAKEQFGTPAALEAAVRLIDSRFIEAGKQYMGGPQEQAAPQHETQASAPAQQAPPPTADVQSGQFQLPKTSDGGDWDEDTKALVKALDEHYQKQLKSQSDELSQLKGVLGVTLQEKQQASQAKHVQEVDEFISSLGPDWKDTFGDGSGWDLKKSSVAKDSMSLQNRIHLDQIASQLEMGMLAYGQTPPGSRREVLSRALRIAFPKQQEQAVRREVLGKVEKRRGQMTARPTQRRSRPITGEEKAMAKAEEWYKQAGIDQIDEREYSTL